MDTGGIVSDDDAKSPRTSETMPEPLEEARVILWVVIREKGITPLDEELARLRRTTGSA